MSEQLQDMLETYEYDGVGYHRGIEFKSWTVAVLNYEERFDKIEKLERHNLTDEVFILKHGSGNEVVRNILDLGAAAAVRTKKLSVPDLIHTMIAVHIIPLC